MLAHEITLGLYANCHHFRFPDYDQILVLDNGKLAEFGTPKELLAKEGGSFRKMCEQASDWSELRATANASGGTKNL